MKKTGILNKDISVVFILAVLLDLYTKGRK